MTPQARFKRDDFVMRRPGTLGATDKPGIVTAVELVHDHMMVTVRFDDHIETFVQDTYVLAYDGIVRK
jgi:hypothetical protein